MLFIIVHSTSIYQSLQYLAHAIHSPALPNLSSIPNSSRSISTECKLWRRTKDGAGARPEISFQTRPMQPGFLFGVGAQNFEWNCPPLALDKSSQRRRFCADSLCVVDCNDDYSELIFLPIRPRVNESRPRGSKYSRGRKRH
jgi:hypothetical protein